ncbi:MAG: AMP-binding protein, partial [Candidatus Omnitrophica bacterium]|nr:AMP-binding protein [Candidatus Omnitrophota bacterium]
PEDIASLVYTSGTTDVPKGVLLTHSNICSNFLSIKKMGLCFPSDNVISLLPLHHTYAFMVTMIMPLLMGGTVTYCAAGFKPGDLGSVLNEAEVTVLVGVPQLFAMLNKAITDNVKKMPPLAVSLTLPLVRARIRRKLGKKLRLSVSGGARLEISVAKSLSRFGFKIIEGYGLTETSPVVTLNPPRKIKFGSVGRPLPDVRIKVSDPDDAGLGQVLIKGPNVMRGYFNQPDLTARAIKDGWFYSGDLGYIDKDGYLFLKGREKDVIVLTNGKNVYPEELEEHYGKISYIKEICVFDRLEVRFGHEVAALYAVVVPNVEQAVSKNLIDIQGRIRWELDNLQKPLPVYKHLMGLIFTTDELPLTILKKIKRYEVKRKYSQEAPDVSRIEKDAVTSDEDAGILGDPAAGKIMNYLSAETNRTARLDDHLELDLGVDSIGRVELCAGLESLFSVKISDETIYKAATVRDVVAGVLALVGGDRSPHSDIRREWKDIIKDPVSDKTRRGVRVKATLPDRLATWLFVNIFLNFFGIFWPLKIKGADNLPLKGPFIICPNHASFLDGFTMARSLPMNMLINTFFVTYKEIVEHPLAMWVVKMGRLMSIDQNTDSSEAIRAISFVLSHNKIVCLFPEGQRSIDEEVGAFKKGIGILVKELDVPAVPVCIKGSHQSWPRGSLFPKPHHLEVIFGKPVLGRELAACGVEVPEKDEYKAIACGLREEVRKLAARS